MFYIWNFFPIVSKLPEIDYVEIDYVEIDYVEIEF